MEDIIKESNFIIIVYVPDTIYNYEWFSLIWNPSVNDILSLKKEIVCLPLRCFRLNTDAVQATDCVVNLVPVLYKSGKPLEKVVPYLIKEMHASRDRLDSAAAKLDAMTRDDPQLNESVMKFIDGIRIMDTGTLGYS